MEFHEKLQELRKRKGLTQEELAQALYVSRAAVSKWESGRGYPSIDSLKAIAKLFSVTIADLLSSDEALTLAEEHHTRLVRDPLFGLLDLSTMLLLFLPLFAQKADGMIEEVSLLALRGISPVLQLVYWFFVGMMMVSGLLMLTLQNCHHPLWLRHKIQVSLLSNIACILLFIVSPQPYVAALLFVFLLIKAIILQKRC